MDGFIGNMAAAALIAALCAGCGATARSGASFADPPVWNGASPAWEPALAVGDVGTGASDPAAAAAAAAEPVTLSSALDGLAWGVSIATRSVPDPDRLDADARAPRGCGADDASTFACGRRAARTAR